jgi:hypothetical protein
MVIDTERQIDIDIASTIFGYTTRVIQPTWYRHEVMLFYRVGDDMPEYSYDENACNAIIYRNGRDDSDGVARPLPFYSNEYEDMRTVLMEMQARDYNAAMSLTGKQWGCHFAVPDGRLGPVEFGEELPQAVARAALAAVRATPTSARGGAAGGGAERR